MAGPAISIDMEDTARKANNDNSNHIKSHVNSDVDVLDGQKRVLRAVPENDDEEDDRPVSTELTPGVDDGFLTNNKNDHKPRHPNFAFPGSDGNDFVEINGVLTPVPDVNAYQHKKTLAQGMMDLALLSANANQLRYVVESYKRHPYYWPCLILISLSIILQVAVGAGLILNGSYNIRNKKEICRANKINNYTVIGIFVVTVVNVIISAFGVADPVG